tara:strand:- start:154 stop:546 length:393 start_codon:yes stop_codon:yes gene_type:complete
MKYIKKLTLVIGILLATSATAESTINPEDLPPWLQPKLLVHIAAMEMDEMQNNEFREALKECLTGLQQVVQREIRKGGVNIPKRIERGIKRQYSELDKRMKGTLKEPQIEHWTSYLEGLKIVMREQASKR